MSTFAGLVVLFFGKQKLNRKPPVPIRGAVWFFDIVVGFGSGIYGLTADFKQLIDPAAQRHRPGVAGIGLPIGGNDDI